MIGTYSKPTFQCDSDNIGLHIADMLLQLS